MRCLTLHPHRSLFDSCGPILDLHREFLKTKRGKTLASLLVIAFSKTSWPIPEVVVPLIDSPFPKQEPLYVLGKELASLLGCAFALPCASLQDKKILLVTDRLRKTEEMVKAKQKYDLALIKKERDDARKEFMALYEKGNEFIKTLQKTAIERIKADPKDEPAIRALCGIMINAANGDDDATAFDVAEQLFAANVDVKYFNTAKDSLRLSMFARGVFDEALIRQAEKLDELPRVKLTTDKGDIVVDTDEGPGSARPEKIPSLRPAFKKDGTVTAANSSSISDGAAALVVMSESKAKELGLTPKQLEAYVDLTRTSPEVGDQLPEDLIKKIMGLSSEHEINVIFREVIAEQKQIIQSQQAEIERLEYENNHITNLEANKYDTFKAISEEYRLNRDQLQARNTELERMWREQELKIEYISQNGSLGGEVLALMDALGRAGLNIALVKHENSGVHGRRNLAHRCRNRRAFRDHWPRHCQRSKCDCERMAGPCADDRALAERDRPRHSEQPAGMPRGLVRDTRRCTRRRARRRAG